MLCDMFQEYMASSVYRSHPDIIRGAVSHLAEEVGSAPRFVLDRSATMMIQNLSTHEAKGFVTALPVCRLPYEKMWIEFAFRDRFDWVQEMARRGMSLSHNENSSPPQRMGYFIQALGEAQEFLIIQPVWSHEPPVVELSHKCLAIALKEDAVPNEVLIKDTEELLRDTEECRKLGLKTYQDAMYFSTLARRIQHVEAPWMQQFWDMIRAAGPKVMDEAETMARYDLAGEWRFVLSLLIALNSRNIMGIGEEVEQTKLNKARAKSGKTPLLPHRPVTLNLSPVQKRRIISFGRGMSKSDSDPHFVRGHFKVRKTGVYWWSPHSRGESASVPEYRVVAR